jgi:hypothetical protein
MAPQQGCFRVGCWAYPDHSLVKAAQAVRDHEPELACARGRLNRLVETLTAIQQVVHRTARMIPASEGTVGSAAYLSAVVARDHGGSRRCCSHG